MKIKNIIFDMGGVILDFRPEKTLLKYFDNKKDRDIILKNVFQSPVWQDMDRGVITNLEAVQLTAKNLPERLHATVRHLLENWFDEMPPKEDVFELIKTLKENGYKIYLLSNVSKDFYDQKDNIPAFEFFDGFLISADYYLLKPEREIYEKLFEKFNLMPEECYFIDDLQKNIDGSKAVGMDGYCFYDGNVEKLKKEMRQKGIKI